MDSPPVRRRCILSTETLIDVFSFFDRPWLEITLRRTCQRINTIVCRYMQTKPFLSVLSICSNESYNFCGLRLPVKYNFSFKSIRLEAYKEPGNFFAAIPRYFKPYVVYYYAKNPCSYFFLDNVFKSIDVRPGITYIESHAELPMPDHEESRFKLVILRDATQPYLNLNMWRGEPITYQPLLKNFFEIDVHVSAILSSQCMSYRDPDTLRQETSALFGWLCIANQPKSGCKIARLKFDSKNKDLAGDIVEHIVHEFLQLNVPCEFHLFLHDIDPIKDIKKWVNPRTREILQEIKHDGDGNMFLRRCDNDNHRYEKRRDINLPWPPDNR